MAIRAELVPHLQELLEKSERPMQLFAPVAKCAWDNVLRRRMDGDGFNYFTWPLPSSDAGICIVADLPGSEGRPIGRPGSLLRSLAETIGADKLTASPGWLKSAERLAALFGSE